MGFFGNLFGGSSAQVPEPEPSFMGVKESVLAEIARRNGGTGARVEDGGSSVSFRYNSNSGKPHSPIVMTPDADGHIADPGPWYPHQSHFPVASFAKAVNAATDSLKNSGKLPFTDEFMQDAASHKDM